MKRIVRFLLVLIILSVNLPANGQGVVTIPVVVHVLWNSAQENIPDANIYDQLNILNADFRKQNADTVNIPAPFRPFAGDAKIEFCLAQRDTNGNATTGITRTHIAQNGFGSIDSITHSALGGDNSWNAFKYLNIWVVVINDSVGGELIGLASSPYHLLTNPDVDGVFSRPDFLGSIGIANNNFAGRAADQQISRWLNLYGTGEFGYPCGDDSVADTPPVDSNNAFGCPPFPYHPNDACGTDSNGEMISNFMTYNDGSCLNFFTIGQIARMHDCLNTIRSGLLTSDGCVAVGINELSNNKMNVKLLPNPSSGVFTLTMDDVKKPKVEIYNIVGQVIYKSSLESSPASTQSTIDLSRQPAGVYIVQVTDEYIGMINKRIIKL